jgi:hypothetical protein
LGLGPEGKPATIKVFKGKNDNQDKRHPPQRKEVEKIMDLGDAQKGSQKKYL